jgi:hypothetical protein
LKALVFALLLVASTVDGAQVFSIPEGKTVYGPFPANPTSKRAGLTTGLTVISANFTSALLRFEYTPDSGTSWFHLCSIGLAPKIIPSKPIPLTCPIVNHQGATNIRVIATVVGGSVGVSALPAVGSK